MDIRNVISRYTLAILGGGFATALLFLTMVTLIRTSFSPVKREANILKPFDKPVKTQEVIALRKPVLKIKDLSEPPPRPSFTSVVSAQRPQYDYTFQITNPLRQSMRPDLDIRVNKSAIGYSYDQSQLGLARTGRGKGNGELSNSGNGINQCTIEFTVGADNSVEDLSWVNCIGADIANRAEKALYEWMRSGASSFVNLNALPGDRLEFTYKKTNP